MSAGIPDPGGVSGTFAALERTSLITPRPGRLVLPAADGGPATTTSLVVANGTDVEHASVLRLIRDNLADFEEFGRVGFEIRPFATAGGTQRREIAILTEEHATLLLTYMRNSAIVRDFKKRLVREFWELRRQAAAPVAMPTHAEALRGWATELERADAAEAKVAELEPSAEAWDRLAEVGADYEVGDAAKILSRDPKISIGRNRLFEFMADRGWIYRGRHNAWKAYQGQVDAGRLKHRPGREYFCKRHNEYRTGDPTIVVTAKGLADLRRMLGGGQLELVVAS